MKLLGFEVKNLVVAMGLGGLLSSTTGNHLLVTLASIVLPLLLLLVLQRIDTRKPEHYLFHLLGYYSSPKFFSSAEADQRIEAAIKRKISK